MPLKLKKLELHREKSSEMPEFMENYMGKFKHLKIDRNTNYIEEMDRNYPESSSSTSSRVIKYTDALIEYLKAESNVEAIIVTTHWSVVEYFSDYHSNHHIPMDYCALSCLKVAVDGDGSQNELILNRHYAYM